MEKLVNIDGSSDLIRDCSNMAVINKNKAALDNAKAQKLQRLSKDRVIEEMQNEIYNIKQNINEILQILKGNN